jgi:hypothetical protein
VTVIERPGSVLSQTPKRVWALGLVSMPMVIWSGMIHALLPLFPVTVLGTSTVTVGTNYHKNRGSHGVARLAFAGVTLIGARMTTVAVE